MKGHWVYLALTVVAVSWILLRLSPRWRKVVLVVSVAALGFLHLELPSVHCIIEGYFHRLGEDFLKAPMILKLALAFIPAVFFGRVFCGYVCPKGAAQELIFIRRLKRPVPRRLDRVLRLLPYLSLGVLVAVPILYDYRLWTDLDPFLWLFQGHGHLPGLVLLGLLVPASVVVCRPFCRYLCPLVPIFRLLSRIAPFSRSTDLDRCRPCKSGVRSCDFEVIDLAPRKCSDDEEGKVRDACRFHRNECLQCNRCRVTCPKEAIR